MSALKPFELGILLLGSSLVLLTLVGLVARRHIVSSWSFGLYLGAVLVSDLLMLFDRFDTMAYYTRKELVLSVLKYAIAFELIGRAFSGFPGAHATARRLFWLVVGLSLVSTVWVAASWNIDASRLSERDVYTRILEAFQPRVLTSITWLYVAIAGLILWYRLPIEAMPKAILIGFVPYLLFAYLALELRTANHWPAGGWMSALDTWAYILLLGYWARSAWQPFRASFPRGRPVPAMTGTA